MKLDHVRIQNFRSISDLTISFNPSCRILVGINESGKSNILRALALLDHDSQLDPTNDVREPLPDESAVTISEVNFVFKLEKGETDTLQKSVMESLLTSEKDPSVIISGKRTLSVSEICKERSGCLFDVNVMKNVKAMKYWRFPNTYSLNPAWRKPSANCPSDFAVSHKGKSVKLKDYILVDADSVEDEIPESYLVDADIEDFAKRFGGTLVDIAKERKPKIIIWEYDERHLLPSAISIDSFCGNPDICVPLRNMFLLAGEKEIASRLAAARKGTPNHFQNYLNRIAAKTTKHFRAVWKEYRDVEFSLRAHADQIVPGVKEKNTHDFLRRSDGFKRFVTFLLMISVSAKMENLANTLLLIDEPEVGLHPSGARYLRDELIRIAGRNYVVFSTHSIFMVQPGTLDRHYIVTKKKEVTDIEVAETSNIANEEILYNALGHSIFSVLKERNIVFEGWKDKRLFEVALGGKTALAKRFKDVGVCYAKGVKSIRAITPLIELGQRECVIVSDNDKPALDSKKKYELERCYGKWYTYADITTSADAITGEDFVTTSRIVGVVNARLEGKGMPKLASGYFSSSSGKLKALSAWLRANGMSEAQCTEAVREIKDELFSTLTAVHVEPRYFQVLAELATKLDNRPTS